MILVIIMTMIMVNVHEAKAKLSQYLEAVAHGERVLICKRNQPIAELKAVEQTRTEPRPIGLGRGTFTIGPAFFEPLPDDFLEAFEGRDPADPLRSMAPPVERKAAARRKRRV